MGMFNSRGEDSFASGDKLNPSHPRDSSNG